MIEFTPEVLADARAKAEAATPGPWKADVLGSEGYAVTGPQGSAKSGHPRRVPRVARCGHEDWDTDRANAAHIARMDPAFTLALLDDRDAHKARADAAEAEVKRLRLAKGPALFDEMMTAVLARAEAAEAQVADLTATVARVKAAAQHPHKGPDDTDASMLRAAAKRLRDGYEPGGSWTKQTVAKVCEVVAAALEGSSEPATITHTEETPMSETRKHHTVVIKHDPASHEFEDCHDECTATLACPGVTDSCRVWWECTTCREARSKLDGDALGDFDENLHYTGEAHGNDHQWINGVWMTPGGGCYALELESDAADLVWTLPEGEHLVDIDSGDDCTYVTALTPEEATR